MSIAEMWYELGIRANEPLPSDDSIEYENEPDPAEELDFNQPE